MASKFVSVAQRLRLVTRVIPEEASLPPLVQTNSSLYKVMVDEFGYPIDPQTWRQTVNTMERNAELGIPCNNYDVQIFNSWAVKPDLVHQFVSDTTPSPDSMLRNFIEKYKL